MPDNPKHTPGPWARNISARYPVYAESDHRKVAAVFTIDGMDGPETMANLNLIAAAPAMLEALRAIADNAYSLANDGPEHTRCGEIALAAIAKAEGREP